MPLIFKYLENFAFSFPERLNVGGCSAQGFRERLHSKNLRPGFAMANQKPGGEYCVLNQPPHHVACHAELRRGRTHGEPDAILLSRLDA